MIRQARVEDIKNKRITRRHGRVVVVTRYYPRYLKKVLLDEFLNVLAPSKSLLREFKAMEAEIGDHDRALEAIDYEEKFALVPAAFSEIERLALLSRSETVYLVCHCKVGERCHRELLLLIARELYGAQISKTHFPWAAFLKRLMGGSQAIESVPKDSANDEILEDLEG